MSSLKKLTALALLGLLTMMLAGTGTGLHIHHGDHGFEKTAHTSSAHNNNDGSCAQHCEGEPLLEHFLENHGSLFNSRNITIPPPLQKAVITLLQDFAPEEGTLSVPEHRNTLSDHQHIHSTGPERAPPFTV